MVWVLGSPFETRVEWWPLWNIGNAELMMQYLDVFQRGSVQSRSNPYFTILCPSKNNYNKNTAQCFRNILQLCTNCSDCTWAVYFMYGEVMVCWCLVSQTLFIHICCQYKPMIFLKFKLPGQFPPPTKRIIVICPHSPFHNLMGHLESNLKQVNSEFYSSLFVRLTPRKVSLALALLRMFL